MRIIAQMTMVLNLDKCIGCHTCSVTCKNVWTTRRGMEYVWFNDVETKPGKGYPTDWENQDKWNGGWVVDKGRLRPRMGDKKLNVLRIFANPWMPNVDDYYEPFTFNYSVLHSSAKYVTPPSARPYSMITGKPMEKIEKSPNWEDDLGGEYHTRSHDQNLKSIEKDELGKFENSFMLYLPRLCEHCLNPACVAVCPSGALYKREEDGIVLIDQNRCRGWRQCVTGCPYKKVYFNWHTRRSEKCTFCYPRIEAGEPTICSETCVGRIRYIGVMLCDADKIKDYASVDEKDLYEKQKELFLDPHDKSIANEARKQGIPEAYIDAAKKSPVYKMMISWKIAFPLHPEYRTLPMVWYVPSLSPIMPSVEPGAEGTNGILPDVESLRIPVKYMANMFTAGDEKPVATALKRLLGLRAFMRSKTIDGVENKRVLEETGMTSEEMLDMYRYLAIADYRDRYVIPTAHTEFAGDAFENKSESGYADLWNSQDVSGGAKKDYSGGI